MGWRGGQLSQEIPQGRRPDSDSRRYRPRWPRRFDKSLLPAPRYRWRTWRLHSRQHGDRLSARPYLAIDGHQWRRQGGQEETVVPGPLELECPSCGGLISITATQRPIQIGCPMCQSQFVIRE